MRSVDSAERLEDARATVSLLFPGARLVRADRGWRAEPGRAFTVAPSVHHARLLLPRAPGDAAAAALRSYGGRLSTTGRWGYRGYAGLMSLTGGRGLGPTFAVEAPGGVRRPGIDDHLGGLLAEPVAVAIHLTPARANRKPVLQALVSGRRTPAAFVKVGTNPLTQRLATQEAAALQRIAGRLPASISAPSVIGCTEFNGLAVLTMAPLPAWQSGRLPEPDEVAAAAAAIAELDPAERVPLSDTPLWQRLTAELEQFPTTADYEPLRAAHEALGAHAGGVDVTTGSSHGDFSPWNMWQTKSGLLIWDWERFASGVPIGSDLVHYRLQQLLIEGVDMPTATREVVDRAAEIVPGTVADPQAARITALAHLLTLAVRYEADWQITRVNTPGHTATWLRPAVNAALGEVRNRPRSV